jgi:biopolymer transport protein ExbB/biopolymer transport protein TolQ
MAKEGSGGLSTVSAGIAEALVTTAVGLLVAIPAVMAHNYLQGWIDARAVDIAESSNEFLDGASRFLESSNIPEKGAPLREASQPEKLRKE